MHYLKSAGLTLLLITFVIYTLAGLFLLAAIISLPLSFLACFVQGLFN
jgi:hypothetical protein